MLTFELLSGRNLEQYLSYLRKAFAEEPDQMTVERIDEEGIRNRLQDPFYQNTKSILAMFQGNAVGRIEYHFYGCMQDGYRMAYVDWVYVLPEYRHRGIARQLFAEFEKECGKHSIDQYFLIRATNPGAERLYSGFENAQLSDEPILRKSI